jgi:PAS domain S-box-containing protein
MMQSPFAVDVSGPTRFSGPAVKFSHLSLLICLLLVQVRAQQLPVKTYTMTDGLAHDRLLRIYRDSHGLLWFCTADGLSKFDGYRFTTYRVEQGLPFPRVNDIRETRGGDYWVATNGGGVGRFNPALGVAMDQNNGSLFANYAVGDEPATERVNVLYEDRAGNLWAGTDGGLFRLEQSDKNRQFQRVALEIPSQPDRLVQVWAFVEDQEGSLWIGTKFGLVRRSAGGQMTSYQISPSGARDMVTALLIDRQQRFWLGHEKGLFVFQLPAISASLAGLRVPWRVLRHRTTNGFSVADAATTGQAYHFTGIGGAGSNDVRVLHQSSDGLIYAGISGGGLTEFNGWRFKSYTTAQGLSDNRPIALTEDASGNLWIGSQTGGAMKVTKNGFSTYTESDGLGSSEVSAVFEDQAGDLFVYGSKWLVHRFREGRFTIIKPPLPSRLVDESWRAYRGLLKDRTGEWWVATGEGLYRFPRVASFEQLASVAPKAVYTTRNGLPEDNVSRVYEDREGNIWIATFSPDREVLTRWERASGEFHRYGESDGLAPLKAAVAFGEDASGNLWIGFRGGGLARFREGSFKLFTVKDGIPEGSIRGFLLDRTRRLWLASDTGGLGRIDDPAADRPQVVWHTNAQGLASNTVTSLAQDDQGYIYCATSRGVDRLDPATGRIKHYTSSDGLAGTDTTVAFRDRHGRLWFGSPQGLSSIVPPPDQQVQPPLISINGLRISGAIHPVSNLGQTTVSDLDLRTDQNEIQIDYYSLSFAAGESPRYQYKLEGAHNDWSAPTENRTVNYARLAPGSYRFLVRAVNTEGMASAEPASFRFAIAPPLWRRWWFLVLVTTIFASVLYALDRYRTARLKELNAALSESQVLAVKLQEQRTELYQANRTLALEYAVTSILGEAPTLSDAAAQILREVGESTKWEVGAIWEVDEQAAKLHCLTTWHMPQSDAPHFETPTKDFLFGSGEGLPGRVWASGESLWITDLAADDNFPRASFAVEERLQSACGLPILVGSEVCGVLEFFSRDVRRPDPDTLAIMSAVGRQLGQLLERKRAEAALRESESRFRTLAQTAADAIITIDQESTILFINPAAERMFGYTHAEMLSAKLTMLMPEYLRHVHEVGLDKYVRTGRRHTTWEAVQLPGLHKSGQEIPLEISFGEWAVGERRFFTGIARDITERKQAEQALRRNKEERLTELERVRTRIATDLHDDIGSSLTQIIVLSEVVQQSMGSSPRSPVADQVTSITRVSRELVDAMSDIVWAINPRKDQLSDLAVRMRRLANDFLGARRIDFSFHAPAAEQNVPLGANVRREVFLIFKESINNIVKHSGCNRAEIEFHINNDWLTLKITDDGQGFDAASLRDSEAFSGSRGGNGLISMRRRAKELGGEFEIMAPSGHGAVVVLTVPVGPQPHGNGESPTHTGGDLSTKQS